MARVDIPVLLVPVDDDTETYLQGAGVALDDMGDGYLLSNPTGKTAVVCHLDESSGITLTFKAVADPYGRGGGGVDDIAFTLSTGMGEFKDFLLNRYSILGFNQDGAEIRQVEVNAASLTGSGVLYALSL